MKVTGECQIWCYINRWCYRINALVTDSLGTKCFILGINELSKSGLILMGWPYFLLQDHTGFEEVKEEQVNMAEPQSFIKEKVEELGEVGEVKLQLADLGDLADMPRLTNLPVPLQEMLHRYREVFSLTLSTERRIKMKPVQLKLAPDAVLPKPDFSVRKVLKH